MVPSGAAPDGERYTFRMRNRKIFIILLSLSLLLFSCIKRREIKVESEKSIVENIIREFVLALESADTGKVLSFYAKSPNVVLIGTGDEFLTGYDSLENFYKDLTSSLYEWEKRNFTLLELKVKILDGVAWFSSKLEFGFELNGKPMEKNIRFSGVLIKEEGMWKLVQTHMSFSSL